MSTKAKYLTLQEVEKMVLEATAERYRYRIDEISLDCGIHQDLGLASFDSMEYCTFMEEIFGLDMDALCEKDIDTLRDMARLIHEELKALER